MSWLAGAKNRVLQLAALYSPGGDTIRPMLHRGRGVKIGRRTWIGLTRSSSRPIRRASRSVRRSRFGIRVTILAHFAHHGRNRESATGEIDDRGRSGSRTMPS
jgi:hypothetical protein